MQRRGSEGVESWHTVVAMSGNELVHDWLTLPDLAERLGIDVGKVRRLVQDREVVGVRRGERNVLSVPARFLVPAHLANPANALPVEEGGEVERDVVLASLRGTISVLTDARFTDEEIVEWLFTPDDSLGQAPIDALHEGRKSAVRRLAQVQL